MKTDEFKKELKQLGFRLVDCVSYWEVVDDHDQRMCAIGKMTTGIIDTSYLDLDPNGCPFELLDLCVKYSKTINRGDA